jgi:predicted lipoprotein with Yx(FWY)xxD motif
MFESRKNKTRREYGMRKFYAAFIALLSLVVFSGAAMAMHHEVKIAEKAELGKYLTDTEGKTLYWFKKDSPEKSACSGPCVDKWPVYFREKVKPPKGLSEKDFGSITRGDGKKQTTFRGYPLYYWTGDSKKGDTNGQGVKDVWFVVDPGAFPLK